MLHIKGCEYMSYKFEEVIKKGTQKIKENINEYKNFLKVKM